MKKSILSSQKSSILYLFVLILFSFSFFLVHTKYTILTSPVQLAYDQFNAIKSVNIRFRHQIPLLNSDNIMFSFSQPLQPLPTNLLYSIYDQYKKQYVKGLCNFRTDAEILSFKLQYYQNGASSNYICQLSMSSWLLTAQQIQSKWLTIKFTIPQDLTNSFASRLGSVNIAIFSSLDFNHIQYQSSNRFSYFYFASLAAISPPVLFNVQIANYMYGNSGEFLTQNPGQIYPVYLQITPVINYSNFVLNIQFTSMNSSNLTSLITSAVIKDYKFYGNCYFICRANITCIKQQYCSLSDDKIAVKITQMNAGQKYVLRFNVINPPFQAMKSIMLWVDQIGSFSDTALVLNQSLFSTPITITYDELRLFWRVPYDNVTTNMGLGFFVDGGINTVEIGFKIDKPSPFAEVLQLNVYIGSTQLIIQSINHNLPLINGTSIYEYSGLYLKIKNIAALTSIGTRYWISFRTRYLYSDILDLIGSVDITLKKYPTAILFLPLVVNVPRVKIYCSDFTDWSGFNNPIFRNRDTQIISAVDNFLQNSTSQAIRKYFNQPTTIGVNPQIANQQLLFLLNVPQANMYLGFANQTYQMKILFNPNIFTSVSDKGIDIIAYNNVTQLWDTASNDCYRNQSTNFTIQIYICQKYNDHVYDVQQDNQLKYDPYFNYYHFVCGNGTDVLCLDTTCKQECRLFKGYKTAGLLTGEAGIAAMRNVNFIPGYQSPVQANDKNLDFIVCFYHAGTLVSASLINAYTIKPQSLQSTTISLINTYHDGTLYNKGDRIPTMMKISGKLSITQYYQLQSPSKMKLYLPSSSAKFTDFQTNGNVIGCTFLCKINQSNTLINSQNWLQMSSITIQNIPPMTNDFKILLPIQLVSSLNSMYIGFQSRGKTIGLYRVGGSSINALLSSTTTPIFSIQTRPNPWDLISNWVVNSSFSYLQSINLQQTNYNDNSTLISMAGSVMPFFNSPYITISINSMQILNEYTTIIAGNTNFNRTCDILNYFYLNKKIQSIICQIFTNDNSTYNNIRIMYPLFDNYLGPGYPYDQVFSFAYASDSVTGDLQGFRKQASDKVKVNTCITSKATQYNIGEIGRQLQIYRFQIDPILLSSTTYTKLLLQIQLPPNIQPAQCSIDEVIYRVPINCAIFNFTGNITILELTLVNTAQSVKLIQFYLNLNCYQLGTVSLNVGSIYKANIFLPHNDGFNFEVIYGVGFNTFNSIAYRCQNSFTYINSAYSSLILIQSYKLNAISLNLNTQLSIKISINKQKSHLLKNSYVQLIFNNLQVNQNTYCYFPQFKHKFHSKTISTSGTIYKYRFYTNKDLKDFTQSTLVHCSNLVLKSIAPTVLIQIFDITATKLILNSSTITLSPTIISYSNTTMMPLTGIVDVTASSYRTLGFNAQYTIIYSISGTGGVVEGYLDISQYSIDRRLIQCKQATSLQQVFCRPHYLSNNLLSTTQLRSRFLYFKTYFTSSFTSFKLVIYPLLQQKLLVPTKLRTALYYNTNLYYIQISDSVPALPVTDPLLIQAYALIPVLTATDVFFNLQISYALFAGISCPMYLQLGQILFYNTLSSLITIKCSIDSTIVPCSVIQKDLIMINTTTYPQSSNFTYKLIIQSFHANYQVQKYDPFNFWIRIFIADPTSKLVNYVSVIQQKLSEAAFIMLLVYSYQRYLSKQYLIWNLIDPTTSYQVTPKIYYGYYGPPIQLITKDSSKFRQDFVLSSLSYNLSTFNCYMGYKKCLLELTADSPTQVTKMLSFTHNSILYSQPFQIYVQVSNAQCLIKAQFSNYKIYQNGMTIPIILNFTHCKPRQPLQIIPSFLNQTQVRIDQTLSTLTVSADNPIGIILVRHQSSITLPRIYTLFLSLNGTYSPYFNIPPSFTIQKIVRTQTSIQGKVPQLIGLTYNSINIRVQCNQPSTVYWANGIYPSTLGVEGEDIQTRLLNGQNGLKPYIIDTLNYGNLQYGINYTDVANVWKHIYINNLRTNQTYTFKYFCLNINGFFSDGQLFSFTTPASQFSFAKVILGFQIPLQYSTQNDYACAIAQSLVVPYAEVVSSFNTNCKDAPFIFFNTLNETSWNFKKIQLSKNLFFYNFYINTQAATAYQIVTTIRDKLFKNLRIMNLQIPVWSSFKIQAIEPNIVTPAFSSAIQIQISSTMIEFKLPISNILNYVVVGLLSNYYNSTTMSLPQAYMIKRGKFSQTVAFDQAFMNFTTGNITYKIANLIPKTQYSLFYFVTVDDPKIDAKHSQIMYLNLVTAPMLQVDLFGYALINKLTLIIMITGLVIFLIEN